MFKLYESSSLSTQGGSMRGLQMFIQDIRTATSNEEEVLKINKEMAHIRSKFAEKNLDGYNRKKYVWKLIYMYMLGYEIEFGHMVALKLITSTKYSEKNAGYMACSIMMNEDDDLLRLNIQSIKKDLQSNNEINQCLALSCVANVGGQEFAQELTATVQDLLVAPASKSFVQKKAALCLLHLYRKYPEIMPEDNKWPPRVIQLLEVASYGVTSAVMSLLLGCATQNPRAYEYAQTQTIKLMERMINPDKAKKSVYKYYNTVCPWVQVKCLKLWQLYSAPQDPNVAQRQLAILTQILKTPSNPNMNKMNADFSIVFEAMTVVIHLAEENPANLPIKESLAVLGGFLRPAKGSKLNLANFRYISLDMMTRFTKVPGTLPQLRDFQKDIMSALKETDISIRKRALDVLFQMCDSNNVEDVIKVLMEHLHSEAYEFREELVLRIAILAERFGRDAKYYVNIILKVISLAGDFVSDDIWYRAVQIITNKETLQDYAATTCFKYLQAPVHENGVKVAAYVLGEFSHQISDPSITGDKVYAVLMSKWRTSSIATRAILMSAAVKLSNAYPELAQHTNKLFAAHRVSVDTEVQQRANEYFNLAAANNQNLMDSVFEVMPHFSARKNPLLRRLKKKQQEEKGEGGDAPAAAAAQEGSGAPAGNAPPDKEGEEEEEESSSSEEEEEKEEEKAPSQQQQTGGGGGILDLAALEEALGGSLVPATQPQEEPMRPVLADPSEINPWAEVLDFAAPVPELKSLFPPQDPALLQKAYGTQKGVLYDTPGLQIGFNMDLSKPTMMTLTLFIGNRLQSDLDNAMLSSTNDDTFRIEYQPAGNAVAANKQAQRVSVWYCLKPFNTVPSFQFTFTHQGRHESIDILLPVTISTFMRPVEMGAPKFIAGWTKVGNECGPALRNIAAPVPLSGFQKILAGDSSHNFMALISSVDQVPDNLYSAGTFCAAPRAEGKPPITIPCLVRIETKPNMPVFRVTVRSGHRLVSEALLAYVTTVMNAK